MLFHVDSANVTSSCPGTVICSRRLHIHACACKMWPEWCCFCCCTAQQSSKSIDCKSICSQSIKSIFLSADWQSLFANALLQRLDPLLHKRSAHYGQVFTVRGWPVSKQNNTSLLMLCLLCWLLRGRRLNLHPVPLSVQIQIGNSAIGGITSSTAAQCFDAMVNPTSDLVLIEFSLNDR